MAQSLCKIYIHLIFHIKTTSPAVRTEDLGRLHSYLGKLIVATGCKEVRAGGTDNHVHILFLLSRENTIAHVVEEVKRNSSRWIKTLSPYYHDFAWQGGYAAFSVSQSVVGKTFDYIDNQKEHHKHLSFRDEYLAFLESYGIDYDKQFVFKD